MAYKTRNAWYFMICLALCLTVPLAEANYTLEALMVSYQNPTHMAVSLQAFRQGCCEASDTTLPCSPCDNAFRVCARESVTGVVWGPCDLAEMESELIEENNDDLVFNWGNVSGISNPIIVSGDMWPGTVEIVFTVYDLDLTATIESSSDVVDNILVHPEVSSTNVFSELEVFHGSFSSLELAFRLICGTNHYGPGCSQCIDTNDTTGHYTCNTTAGGKVCLEGYQDPQKNCTNCTPAETCSSEGGYCSEPGECLCKKGFSGDNCGSSVHTSATKGPSPDPSVPSRPSEPSGSNVPVYISLGVSGLTILLVVAVVTFASIAICLYWKRRSKLEMNMDGNMAYSVARNELEIANAVYTGDRENDEAMAHIYDYIPTTEFSSSANEAYNIAANINLSVTEAYEKPGDIKMSDNGAYASDANIHVTENEAYAKVTDQ